MSHKPTISEQLLKGVAALIHDEGKTVFTRNDVRQKLDVDRDKWNASYSPIFQGMRAAPSGIGAPVGENYKNVFDRVAHGKYRLTSYGQELVDELEG